MFINLLSSYQGVGRASHFKMQMAAGRPAGCSHKHNQLSLSNLIADTNKQLTRMTIQSDHPVGMLNFNIFSISLPMTAPLCVGRGIFNF